MWREAWGCLIIHRRVNCFVMLYWQHYFPGLHISKLPLEINISPVRRCVWNGNIQLIRIRVRGSCEQNGKTYIQCKTVFYTFQEFKCAWFVWLSASTAYRKETLKLKWSFIHCSDIPKIIQQSMPVEIKREIEIREFKQVYSSYILFIIHDWYFPSNVSDFPFR